MPLARRITRLTIAMLTITPLLAGCAYSPPRPWEKGQLARPDMRMEGSVLEQRYREHIYSSKENAAGSDGVGGGGCGCN